MVKKFLVILLIILCVLTMIFSILKLSEISKSYRQIEETQTKIRDTFYVDSYQEQSSMPKDPVTNHQLELPTYDFTALLNINPDVIGWLRIPAAEIDHVVVQSGDNTYYMHRTLYGEYEYAGTLFADYRYTENSNNLLIYGHSMTDGSMMGHLRTYLDPDICATYPYFYYFTPTATYRCEIISTYLTTTDNPYLQTDFSTDQDFMTYVNTAVESSVYNFSVDISPEDKIMTLSTCNYTEVWEEGRQVLHAKMIRIK